MRVGLALGAAGAVVLGVLGASFGGRATGAADGRYSAELAALFAADQAERIQGALSPEHDRERLARVKAILGEDALETAADHYHAAMILQHSPDRSGRDHLTAHVLCTIAAAEGHEPARWLAAATLDRFLDFDDQPQFFGTQFQRDEQGQWRPGAADPARTERVREWFSVPTAEVLQGRADGWNRR